MDNKPIEKIKCDCGDITCKMELRVIKTPGMALLQLFMGTEGIYSICLDEKNIKKLIDLLKGS